MADRNVELGGIWANGAGDVPGSPVGGVTYKKSGISEAEIEQGWYYSTVNPSELFNEVMYRMTSLLVLLETYGILPWCASTTYIIGSKSLGSDMKIYKSLKASNTNHNPISSPTWWQEDDVAGHATETSTHGATTAATADRIALRDSNGDIRGRLLRSEYNIATGDCNYLIGQKTLGDGDGTDNYHRPMTFNAVRTALLAMPTLNYSKSYNGFTTLPGGIIFQWGQYRTSAAGLVIVTLPTTFPTTGIWAIASYIDEAYATVGKCGAYPYSRSSVRLADSIGNKTIMFACIGW